MRKLLLVLFTITIFSCSQEDEPTARMANTNTATIEITTDSKVEYAFSVAYLTKDKWETIEPEIVLKELKGSQTIQVQIDKEQNFVYSIQRKPDFDDAHLSCKMSYRQQSRSKTFNSTPGGVLWDIYEFYKQAL